jgi:hypothetical protein
MKLQIDDDWIIEIDYRKDRSFRYTLNLINTRRLDEKTGNYLFTIKMSWSYDSFTELLKGYLNNSVEQCQSVQQILDRIDEVEKKIETMNKNAEHGERLAILAFYNVTSFEELTFSTNEFEEWYNKINQYRNEQQRITESSRFST